MQLTNQKFSQPNNYTTARGSAANEPNSAQPRMVRIIRTILRNITQAQYSFLLI